MELILSNFMMCHLDDFCDFLFESYPNFHDTNKKKLLEVFVVSMEQFNGSFRTIDLKINDTSDERVGIYNVTHIYLYGNINKLCFLGNGFTNTKNTKYWDYILKNLPIFEREIKLNLLLDDDV